MGKGGGGGNQDNTTQVRPPGFIQPALNTAADAVIADYERGPLEFFPDQTYVGFDPLQQQAQAMQLAYGSNPALSNQIGALQQASLSALGGPENLMSDPAVNAALDSIESRSTRNLMENILPNVRRGATGAGQTFGSTKMDVNQAMQIGDVAQRIADAQGTFLGNQLDSARTAQARAMGLAPQTMQAGLFPSQIFGSVGAERQGMAGQELADAMSRWNFEQQAPIDATNRLVNQAAGLAGFGGTTTTNFDQGGSNPLLGALGGGLAGSALANSALVTGFSPLAGLGAFGGLPAIAGGAILGGLFT